MTFLEKHGAFTKDEFEKACGVGVVVTQDDIKRMVSSIMTTHKDALVAERYRFNVGVLLAQLRTIQPWADGKLVKEEVDRQVLALLGPKTAEDTKPAAKKAQEKKESCVDNPATKTEACSDSTKGAFAGEVLKFHKPEENLQLKPEILERHLKATGGRVMTRFPPEPNGFLHIGHAKAINLNFRYADVHGGLCYLRYDDTNPEAEEEIFFVSIKEMVEWLGFKPWKITHSSDYFEQLYEYAKELVRRDKAYICHQTAEEIHESRGGDTRGQRKPSPWRDRPVEESLRLFEDMRAGKFKENEAILRMKMDLDDGNPYMWDPVAYRVLYKPHPRTGTKWVIYPTYDFAHPLCDSLENITHSLCTTEFKLARPSYYWLCDAVEAYRAVQWEYGRLSITNTVLSKRKLTQLVSTGCVRAWDDPRLFTLAALKRRGFTPKAINAFVEKVGITTSQSTIEVKLLEACVRDDLNSFASRVMAVLDPLKVTITNYTTTGEDSIVAPNVPGNAEFGERRIPFGPVIYIDRSDFRETADDPNYYRLAPGKEVGLHRAFNITCERIQKDATGKITEIFVTYDRSNARKPKAHIHWVAESKTHKSPVVAQVRLYSNLFKSRNPTDKSIEGGWLSDINPQSLTIVENALVDCGVATAKVGDKFQFERVGYFCVDPDSTAQRPVFNLTVSLKEDSKKV